MRNLVTLGEVDVGMAEVDGVYAVWSPVPGPLQACLMFGTGRIDETLAQAGINHLVEHLALQSFGHTPYAWDGDVSSVVTRFHAMGNADQVAQHLTEVAASLGALPVDKLDHEARVLAIEAQRRAPGQAGYELIWRFGARGPGLLGFPEYGLRRITADEVLAWTAARFTRGNAFLWLSGPPPAGLSFGALRDGNLLPSRELPSSLVPGWSLLSAPTELVSVSMLTGQDWAVGLGIEITRQRALDRLRRDRGITYSIQPENVRVSSDRSISSLSADAGRGESAAVLEELTGVLRDLAESGPTNEEIERFSLLHEQMLTHPQTLLGYLNNAAERHLLGLPFVTPEELDERVRAVTPEAVRDGLAAVVDTIVAVGPTEMRAAAPWSRPSGSSSEPVRGHPFVPLPGRETGSLAVADEGVTWTSESGESVTVRWAELAGCLAWDSGLRRVMGVDGNSIVLAPWNWYGGEWLTGYVDRHTPPSLRIPIGEGTTTYQTDSNDPSTVTELRWLASILGARHNGGTVDLVIRSDGIGLLYRVPSRTQSSTDATQSRLARLRQTDWVTLIKENDANRWIPYDGIHSATVVQGRWPRSEKTLEITSGSGTTTITLVNEHQVQSTSNAMSKMLAGKFHR